MVTHECTQLLFPVRKLKQLINKKNFWAHHLVEHVTRSRVADAVCEVHGGFKCTLWLLEWVTLMFLSSFRSNKQFHSLLEVQTQPFYSVGTTLTFSSSLPAKPVSYWALFINLSSVKCSEQTQTWRWLCCWLGEINHIIWSKIAVSLEKLERCRALRRRGDRLLLVAWKLPLLKWSQWITCIDYTRNSKN